MGKSFRQFLVECAQRGLPIRTTQTKLPVVYAPRRSNDRFPWVDENGEHYPCHHVEAVNPKTNRRYNP